jgi:recombination protein RecR
LIDNLKNLPGIGNKTAERLAFSMIGFDKTNLTNFANAIIEVRDKITYCHLCGNIAEDELCSVCSNQERDFSTIFVVE